MSKAWLLLAMALGGCAPSLKIDVSCIIEPGRGAILMNCTDVETWREWREKQAQENRQ